jgi:hypothetical protein
VRAETGEVDKCVIIKDCIPACAKKFEFYSKSSFLTMQLILLNVEIHSDKKHISCISLDQVCFLTGRAQHCHLLKNKLCQYLIAVHPHGLLKPV